ncbi:MAG: type II toxin-antitoxin system RelE/ParE family toxin [Acidobacteria bacterium]|nr:type II toxin-antitoxin system RelE/ParE family toxin [Acidobacteriota bacterium]
MAKKRPLLISAEAAADLDNISDPLFSAILKRLQLLQQNPEMGQAMFGAYRGLRATPVGIFRIIYRVTSRGVEIVYIRHCKRKMPNP